MAASFTYSAVFLTLSVAYYGNIISARIVSKNNTIPATRQSSCSCGVSTVRKSSRIINGSPAVVGEFPWRCIVYTTKSNSFCSGTIISPSIVMVAAHCLDPLIPTDGLVVDVGDLDMGSTTETPSFWTAARAIAKHPAYDRATLKNDIALVYLQIPLTFSPTVQPACLPFALKGLNLDLNKVTVSGWGMTKYGGSVSEKLMKAEMLVLPEAVCRRSFGTAWPETNLCVGMQGKSACSGDSGGGADFLNTTTGRSYTIGVTSAVAPGCNTNVPNIFTRVTNHLDWIISMSHGDTFCQPE
ncbi:chymotrypsinogen A [Folsomia candida]|uniref:Venom serine protease n=1 Tax=Folsomia candida TaxID=158441 RepID=A0A226F4J2_FOLCA|nr:chymotrypsinogen A [Folsomia candida]OXA64703.1 Venom serine protease [Folsomia candida]